MKFENYNISDEIKTNLENMGFRRPTDIQYKAIPSILKGEDVLAIAQTGTGKTAAFAIPIIDMLHFGKTSKRIEGIRCIVMVPTHELAIQVGEVFTKIGEHTRVKTFCVYGGVDQDPQIAQLQRGIDILVATPGRMFDLISQGYIHTRQVETLILDEADHMLDLGFIQDIQDLIRFLPRKRQTLFFSATINETIKKLAYSLVNKPVRIQISPKDPVAKNITHSVVHIKMDDKRFFLERMVKENSESKILVFVRTKVRAERVCKAMERVGIKSLTIHSDKIQKERVDVMQQFKKGIVKILIATDVSARGIDIPNVAYVINYDMPRESENYVHRVGRTGRGKNKGMAFSFCSEEEKPILAEITQFLGKPIHVLDITKADYLETLADTNDDSGDWRDIMAEAESAKTKKKRKKKK